MSQINRLGTTALILGMSPKDFQAALKDPDVQISDTSLGLPGGSKGNARLPNFFAYVKGAVGWKGHKGPMPDGAYAGLGKAIATSQAARGVLGTAIDPRTGCLVTRKDLKQRALSPGRSPRKPSRSPGTVPYANVVHGTAGAFVGV